VAEPASQQTVRLHNRALVLQQVALGPATTRARVAEATGLTRATVSTLVDELIESSLVVELEPGPVMRGRPGYPIQLNPQGPAGLGIEVNVDYISAAIVDLTGVVRARRIEAVDNQVGTVQAGLRRISKLAAAVTNEVDLRVAGVGLAVPGLVDPLGGLREAPNLPRWQGIALPARLQEAVGIPVVTVENEANLAAQAEHWYGTRLHDFVHVSGEIGVGGGLIVGGELFRGVRGFAGELGHIVVDPRGPRCPCGNRGCLEQLAGQARLLDSAQASTTADLVSRAETGQRRALAGLSSAGTALGVALGGVINVIDMPAVVLGGFYAQVGRWLVEPLEAELRRRVISREPVDIHVSTLGSEAATLGAAGVVVRQILAGKLA
jgi:predicted NBD/HSP70 family sugar kinase